MNTLHLAIIISVLSLVGTGVVQAQGQDRPNAIPTDEAFPVRVLEIHDGDVKLDGRVLPSENLPVGLSLGGIDMIYQFSGPVTPVLEIDGEVFVLDGDHLIRMEDAEPNRANVYFLGQPEAQARMSPASGSGMEMEAASEQDDRMGQAGEDAYLQQLSSRDRTLYDQIQHEQSLELETYRLAAEFQRSSDPLLQNQIEEALRNKLSESFELKQRIRGDEIEQAETQIDELRRLLDTREARKAQIIERRLRELLGKHGN